jgi:hypothetical protein
MGLFGFHQDKRSIHFPFFIDISHFSFASPQSVSDADGRGRPTKWQMKNVK